MVESKRNEPRGADLTAALRKQCADIIGDPLYRLTNAGRALILLVGILRAWSADVEERLGFLEAGVRPPPDDLPPRARQRLYGLLTVGAAEGQLGDAISDQARPGGARPGDMALAPIPGDSYGGSD